MFSYLFGSKKSTAPASAADPTRHRSSRSRDFAWPSHNGPTDDYDDVSLSGGAHDGSGSSRRSFSAPSTSHGSFVGADGRPTSSNAVQEAYPPLPAFSRPSTANGYPSIRRTLERLTALLAEQSPSLHDSLAPPLLPTDPALASLLHAISPYHLPPAVFETYAQHDGQDPFASGGSNAGGLFWGLWWMPIDQVEQEWRFWRRFEAAGGGEGMSDAFSASTDGSRLRSRAHPYTEDSQPSKADLDNTEFDMHGMSSFPAGWVRQRYSHPGWLPLLTDRCGNYIGVDLDPPPPLPSEPSTSASGAALSRAYGQPGQVIAFGREIDEKVVLFPGDGAGGWGRFLAAFVDDVEKGEFATLVDGVRKRKAGPNGWREDDDEESARGGSSPDSDEWGVGDGLGERSYFDGDRYGEEDDDATESQRWLLRREYRKKLDPDAGGIIALIADRSRNKWKSLGVGSLRPTASSIPAPKPQAPLTVVVPAEAGEPGPESSITLRPASPDQSDRGLQQGVAGLSIVVPNDRPSLSVETVHDTASVEVVLSPPSPTVVDGQAFQPGGTNYSVQAGVRSPELLDDGRPAFPTRGLQDKKRKSRKPPPPPPAAIDLPTAQDFAYATSVGAYEDHGLPSDSIPSARTSTSSTRSYVSASSSAPPPLLPTHSSSSSIVQIHGLNGATSSTTALVPAQDGTDLQSPTGLGIDSPELDKHTMEIIVDQNRPTSPAISTSGSATTL